MVAEGIDIQTRYDPHLVTGQNCAIHIKIPSVEKQFRIEKLSAESTSIGTTVRVFVEGKNLPKNNDSDEPHKLDVTQYLCNVAGFVEFPIVITEGKRKTVILHPDRKPLESTIRFGDEFDIHQIDLEFPWEEVFLPQDLSSARDVYEIERCNLRKDLKLENFEGVICWPVVRDGIELYWQGRREFTVVAKEDDSCLPQRVRWDSEWEYGKYDNSSSKMGVSGQLYNSKSLFRDGVLVSRASLYPLGQYRYFRDDQAIPNPMVVINLTKNAAVGVDSSRRQIVAGNQLWDKALWESYFKIVISPRLSSLMEAPLLDRVKGILNLIAHRGISAGLLWEHFEKDKWPIPMVSNDGKIEINEWRNIKSCIVFGMPNVMESYSKATLNNAFGNPKLKPHTPDGWNGDRFIIDNLDWHCEHLAISQPVDSLWNTPKDQSHSVRLVRFLVPPIEDMAPLLQRIWEPIIKDVSDASFLEAVIKDPLKINGNSSKTAREKSEIFRRFNCLEFNPPYQNFFGYGTEIFNIKHPLAKVFVKSFASLRLAEIQEDKPKQRIRELQGLLEDTVRFMQNKSHINVAVVDKEWQDKVRQSIASVAEFLDMPEFKNVPIPTHEDFVPGTAATSMDLASKLPGMYFIIDDDFKASRPWGMAME